MGGMKNPKQKCLVMAKAFQPSRANLRISALPKAKDLQVLVINVVRSVIGLVQTLINHLDHVQSVIKEDTGVLIVPMSLVA